MTTAIDIHGTVDAAFSPVRDAFRANFEDHGEIGASLCVYADGKPVVDIWGGFADAARTRAWEHDTITCVWSSTKGVTATCANRLAGEGKLDVDAPVAQYWPEFAQAGKESTPVRWLLTHQAGLPAIRADLPPNAPFDWDVMTEALARETPWWEPGTKHGYHAFTYGWLVGEVVRRISGMSLGEYWRKEIAEPLGIDFHIGFGPEHDGRVAEMVGSEPSADPEHFLLKIMADPEGMPFRALTNPPEILMPDTQNSREWRAAEIPAANGHGNGRSLARHYAALARGGELDGVQIVTPEALEAAIIPQTRGRDEVLGLPLAFGLGYAVNNDAMAMGPNARSFGHSGAGGSLGFADPDARVGFGYAMNRQIQPPGLADPRWVPMIAAVYECL